MSAPAASHDCWEGDAPARPASPPRPGTSQGGQRDAQRDGLSGAASAAPYPPARPFRTAVLIRAMARAIVKVLSAMELIEPRQDRPDQATAQGTLEP